MAEVIPTHTHAVVDADRPFVIDPNTMEVTSRDANLKLPQHSKNAEVFTFTLSSSVVEGYDLATCNSVKVHYENVDSKTGKISAGLYTVSDFSANENGVTLSWVVDDDATRYVGALIFSIHFSCFDEDGALVYNLPTLTYSKITVGATVWLSDTIEREYPDIVTEFERRLSVMEKAPAVLCSPQVLSPEKKAQARFNIKACDAGIITGTSDTLTWDGNRDGVFSYFMYSKVSDVVPSIGIEDFANGCYTKGVREGYGETEEFHDSSDVIVDSRGIIAIGYHNNNTNVPQSNLGSAAIVPRDYYAEDGTIELEKGVYFYDMRVVGFEIYGVSLTIPGYTGFGRQQLDPALLPDSVATKEYVDEAIAESGGGGTGSGGNAVASVEPAEDDIPKVFFGGALQQTKTEAVVPFRYISKTQDISGYAEIKAQGNSSMSYPKKNQTVKLFKDAGCTEKLKVDFKGWGKQNKHVYKANWIDLSHARNVVSARLWADIVKSRANYAELPELLRTSPNQGAVDGFPVKVYADGVYQGRYTLNIPKDKWMANMDDELDTHCILCGEGYVSGCFREASVSQWTDEIHDSMPSTIRTRWIEVINFVMNSTDEEFKANLGNYFDIPSLIDYHLFGLAICGLDAYGKNQLYMTYDGQKWLASMYDMDSTWGLYWNGNKFVPASYSREEYEDMISGRQGNLLYIRLEQLFWQKLQSRWPELKAGALSIENIINRFERFTDIAPVELVKEDYASTTGGGAFTGIPSRTTNNIQQIRAFALARQAWTDEYVAGLTPEEQIPCTGITLSATELTFTEIGTQTLTATVTPEDCTDVIVWTSSAASVAKVSNGVVTAIGNGSAIITATCGEYSASCAVSVSGVVHVEYDTAYSLTDETTFVSADETYIDTGIQLLDTDKAFTVFLKFRGSTSNLGLSNYHAILHCVNEQTPWPGCGLQISQEKYRTFFYSANQDTISYNDTDVHTWILRKTAGNMNVTLTFDGADYTMAGGTYKAVTQNLLIGCYQKLDGTKDRFWNGTVYECHVWNRVLTDVEVAALSV